SLYEIKDKTGYGCPFCEDTLKFNPELLQMIEKLSKGFAHIISHPTKAEIQSKDTHFYIPKNKLFESVETIFKAKGINVEGLSELVFRNPTEDLSLIHLGMNSFDTHKWIIIIESSDHPEPLLLDDPFWSSL